MSAVKDLTGKQFGMLTVLERDLQAQTENHSRRSYWKCQCICGNIISRSSGYLKQVKIPSCGCYNNQRESHIIDMTGMKIGKLTVVNRNDEYYQCHKQEIAYRDTFWNCICECGNTCIRSRTSLMAAKQEQHMACCDYCRYTLKNLQNQRRFMLTMLYPINQKRDGYNIWHCKCDCGNEIDLTTNELSWTTSCGCQQNKSKGEVKIETILKENNIKFIYNKGYFKDLLYPSGVIGRYDFILLDDKDQPYRLIEFDGKQHYSEEANSFFCGPNSQDTFKEIQIRDNIKNEYAKIHNLPLILIPYNALNKINIDMLLGDKFLI